MMESIRRRRSSARLNRFGTAACLRSWRPTTTLPCGRADRYRALAVVGRLLVGSFTDAASGQLAIQNPIRLPFSVGKVPKSSVCTEMRSRTRARPIAVLARVLNSRTENFPIT